MPKKTEIKENKVGPVIEARLREMGKPQKWLADQCGVSAVSVFNWIKSGEIARRNIGPAALALGISADKLMGTEFPHASAADTPPSRPILQWVQPDEQELLEGYRLCTEDGKHIARDFVTKVAPKKHDGETMLGRPRQAA